MTTTVETNKVNFTGNGATVDFAFTFRVFSASDLEVYVDGVLKTLTTDYTVAIDASVEGGTVTFVTAPASSTSVLIKRVLDFTQPSDIPTESNFPEATIENALDRATMLLVQLKEILSRVPALAVTSLFSDLVLPDPSADKVLGWNSAADALENKTLSYTTSAFPGTFGAGVDASKPASPAVKDLYFATDTNILYRCITVGTWTAATNRGKGSNIASATTTDIGAATGDVIDVTGTTTITGLGTISAGVERIVRFTGALTLTHNATSLILPGGASITTANGDVAKFVSLGSGNWYCAAYQRASGLPIVVDAQTMLYSATRFKISNFSRDLTTASGTQAITGIGFAPKAVIFLSVLDGLAASWGFSNVTGDRGLLFRGSGGPIYGTGCIQLQLNTTPDQQFANVQSLDSDGFTLNWTKQNSPTGTANIFYLALR